jgi:hypothetical protein
MKVKGLNGRTYPWKLHGHIPLLDDERQRSGLHKQVRQLLKEVFPLDPIYEEVYLPGSDGLSADFVIPTRDMIVEAHGEQHYKFVSYFYKTIYDFVEAKKRDAQKVEWAELNKLKLIALPYNESVEQWTQRLTSHA